MQRQINSKYRLSIIYFNSNNRVFFQPTRSPSPIFRSIWMPTGTSRRGTSASWPPSYKPGEWPDPPCPWTGCRWGRTCCAATSSSPTLPTPWTRWTPPWAWAGRGWRLFGRWVAQFGTVGTAAGSLLGSCGGTSWWECCALWSFAALRRWSLVAVSTVLFKK